MLRMHPSEMIDGPTWLPLASRVSPYWDTEGWTEGLGWVFIVSDIAISLAFVGVLWSLAEFLRRRDGSTFHRLFALVGLFVFVAGAAYFVRALTFWYPLYTLLGVLKVATAIASWVTVVVLLKMMPQLVDLPSMRVINQRLSEEIDQRKETERALLAAQARYQALMDGTRVIVWTTDAEGKFVTPQVSWQLYTGQPWEEHQGFGWVAALHEEDQVMIEQIWGQAVENKSIYRAKGRIWNATSQSHHPFLVEAAPIIGEDGEIKEWFGTVSELE